MNTAPSSMMVNAGELCIFMLAVLNIIVFNIWRKLDIIIIVIRSRVTLRNFWRKLYIRSIRRALLRNI